MSSLFSIGYAGKSIDNFLKLLTLNEINVVCDVRTSPFSKQFSEYNRDYLQKTLKENGIIYMYFGDEFGARRSENVYEYLQLQNGEFIDFVNFENVYELEVFKKGYERIVNGVNKGYKICFMCSEKYPYDCHRAIMVSEYFSRNGFDIKHIIDFESNVTLKAEDKDYNKKQLIDLDDNKICYLSHSNLISCLEEDYFKMRTQFNKSLLQSGFTGLDEEAYLLFPDELPRYFEYWKEYYKLPCTREVVIRHANIRIGYRRGEQDE